MSSGVMVLPDNALVVAMGNGDQSALDELKRRYFLILYAKAISIVFDPVKSESVVGQVFHAAWQSAATFEERGPGGVHAWLLDHVYERTASGAPSSR